LQQKHLLVGAILSVAKIHASIPGELLRSIHVFRTTAVVLTNVEALEFVMSCHACSRIRGMMAAAIIYKE